MSLLPKMETRLDKLRFKLAAQLYPGGPDPFLKLHEPPPPPPPPKPPSLREKLAHQPSVPEEVRRAFAGETDTPVSRYIVAFDEIVRRYWQDDYRAILEWGPGYSTWALFQFLQDKPVDLLLTIEDTQDYLDWVLEKFPPTSYLDGRVIHQIEQKDTGYNYATYPLTLNRQFDFIFVDGRRRNECLLAASRLLSENGVVVLHDCLRPRYQMGKDLFNEVEVYGGGFSIMKRKA